MNSKRTVLYHESKFPYRVTYSGKAAPRVFGAHTSEGQSQGAYCAATSSEANVKKIELFDQEGKLCLIIRP
jgi:hypothetical protein